MSTFAYKGTMTGGKPASGVIEAVDIQDARSLLLKQRIRPTKLKAERPPLSISLSRRVGLRDVAEFSRELAEMVGAEIPLMEALDLASEQTGNPRLQNCLKTILGDVRSGLSLGDALARHPKTFDRLYCAMVKAGEAGGILPEVLDRLAEHKEASLELRSKIRSSMSYPAVVAVVAMGTLFALVTFGVPIFSEILREVKMEMPAVTKMVIAASDFCRKWVLWILGGLVLASATVVWLYRNNSGFRGLVDWLRLKAPLVGDLHRKRSVARFTATLGALAGGKVALPEALEITAATSGNVVIEEAIRRTSREVQVGKSMGEPLAETGAFPPMVIHMITVGEKTGKLPKMLARVSKYYDGQVDRSVSALTSVVEPIMLVFMGVVVTIILVSMYLPLFDMITGMQ